MILGEVDFLILVFVVLANLSLAFIVIRNRPKDISSIFFSFLAVNLAAWSIVNYFSLQATPDNFLLWVRLVLFFAAPQAVFFFLFIYHFPSEKLKLSKFSFSLIILLLLSVLFLTMSDKVFMGMEQRGDIIVPLAGPGMVFFAVFTLGFILGGIFVLIRRLRQSQGLERAQWLYIFSGLVVTFVLIVLFQFFFVVIFHSTFLIKYAPLFTLPLIVFISYAIIKHHLLDIKVIAAEILSIALSFFMLIAVITSREVTTFIINSFIFIAVLIVSILLVRNVLREVGQRQRLEKLTTELKSANARLKKLDEAKTEFLSITSHQLRTPLSAIKGYLSMLNDGDYGKLTRKQGEIIGILLRNSERLIRLINIFLNISRIESGRLKINKTLNNINRAILDIIKSLQIEAKNKNIKIIYKSSDLPPLQFDSDKVADVILNLVDNAIKYTSAGGRIEVMAQLKDKYVLIMVRDNGTGIPYEELDNLFEKFKRGREINKVDTSGVGLGLYIAKKIIEGHGGNIWAESEGYGKGAIFKFTLPLD